MVFFFGNLSLLMSLKFILFFCFSDCGSWLLEQITQIFWCAIIYAFKYILKTCELFTLPVPAIPFVLECQAHLKKKKREFILCVFSNLVTAKVGLSCNIPHCCNLFYQDKHCGMEAGVGVGAGGGGILSHSNNTAACL